MVLALDHHPMDPSLESILEQLNLVLTGIFFLEMVTKMIGLGIEIYLRNPSN